MRTGEYIRWAAVHGTIKIYDNSLTDRLLTAFNSVGTLINQIAKVVNSTGGVYKKDIEDVQKEIRRMKRIVDSYLSEFDPDNIT